MDTVADAAFCNHCGERLPARCRACDTLNPPGSAFCYSCGSPIAAAASGAPPYAPPPPRMSAVCPRCSKVSEPGSAYCYSCGLPFDETPPAYARYDSRQAWRGDAYECEGGELEPVGFWIRLAAFLIDAVVAFAVAFIIALVFSVVEYNVFERVFFAFLTLYHTIGWSRWSTTVGKRIFNLYVVRTDGAKIGFWRAFGRLLSYYVSAMIFGIGFLMIASSEDKRGLHDLMCDTVVIRRR